MDQSEITKLVTYIEENLRASPVAGLQFVDSRKFRTRLISKQNHVIFGRRGAGKTTLAKLIGRSENSIEIYLNLKDFKDITFPSIIIQILVEMFGQLRDKLNEEYRFKIWLNRKAFSTRKEIVETMKVLNTYLYQPDIETQKINTQEQSKTSFSAGVGNKVANVRGSIDEGYTEQISREVSIDKLEFLRLEFTKYKNMLISLFDLLGEKPIFLILDDYYFISEEIQPELIDYFHRLTKGTSLFIKVATIKHRTKLYRRSNGNYTGVELGHDVFEIDMDYTLDKFGELQDFMRQLLLNAVGQSNSKVELEDIFAGDGFTQLCLASGGVPRDFLSLFVKLANQTATGQGQIGKVEVTSGAISNLSSKYSSMQKDSGDDQSILEHCLARIKMLVYGHKRTNAFLIAKSDLESDPTGKQAIRELVDLRLIHLVDDNTSKAPSDGRRYEAYILDLGLYDNPRPRNFKQIEPGYKDNKSRKDDLRATPVFDLALFREKIPEQFTLPSVDGPSGENPPQLS